LKLPPGIDDAMRTASYKHWQTQVNGGSPQQFDLNFAAIFGKVLQRNEL